MRYTRSQEPVLQIRLRTSVWLQVATAITSLARLYRFVPKFRFRIAGCHGVTDASAHATHFIEHDGAPATRAAIVPKTTPMKNTVAEGTVGAAESSPLNTQGAMSIAGDGSCAMDDENLMRSVTHFSNSLARSIITTFLSWHVKKILCRNSK